MSQINLARIYMLFALALMLFAWKITKAAKAEIQHAQAKQAAAIERLTEN
jgi:hypothetical protein